MCVAHETLLCRAVAIVAQQLTGRMIASFKDFPPRQRPASFNLDDVMRSLTAGSEGN